MLFAAGFKIYYNDALEPGMVVPLGANGKPLPSLPGSKGQLPGVGVANMVHGLVMHSDTCEMMLTAMHTWHDAEGADR